MTEHSEGVELGNKAKLIREVSSTLAFLALLMITLPGSLLGVTALLPANQRIWGLVSLASLILLVTVTALILAIRYPVVFLGYNHPVVIKSRLHGPPAPGLYVYTKSPGASTKLTRPSGAVIWSEGMQPYVGKLAIITAVDKGFMTAKLDIDGGAHPWAWEWLDFIETS